MVALAYKEQQCTWLGKLGIGPQQTWKTDLSLSLEAEPWCLPLGQWD